MKRRGRMEEYEVEPGEICEYTTRAFTAPHQANHFGPPRFDTAAGPSRNKKKNKKMAKITHQVSPENNVPVTEPVTEPAPAPGPVITQPTAPSVSSCYIFKSRLQEYAQRAQLESPVYETTKEGPPHEPIFSSTVTLNGVRYDSLPGFFNRKASEQSAAEVALSQLCHSADMKFGITVPVSETGLSKNLLQEYAQKMNYAVPLYDCHRIASKKIMYSCTVDVGGTKYIGAPASAKKEAEIKAARVALLAIQSAGNEDPAGKSVHVVIPQKKRPSTIGIGTLDTVAVPKPKRNNKQRKRKYNNKKGKKGELEGKIDGEEAGAELVETGGLDAEATVNDFNTGVFDDFVVPLNGGDFGSNLDGMVLDMDVQQSGVTHNVSSQEKAIGLNYLYKATGTDSEVGYIETALDNCSSGINKGIEENDSGVAYEGLHKETLDIKPDVSTSQHDMSDDMLVGEARLESTEIDSVTNVVISQGIDYVNDLVSSNEGVLKEESDINMFDQESVLSSVNNKGIDEIAPYKQNGVPNNCSEEFDLAEASTNKIEILGHLSIGTSQNDITNDVMAGEVGLEPGKAIDDSEELSVTTGVSEEGLDVKMCDQESGLSAFSTIADDFVM